MSRIHEFRDLIEGGLCEHLPVSRLHAAQRLNEALHYAVFPGGKRLRPVLTLLGARTVSECVRAAVPAACAVEFLHTSSLIFDDMPCMDDADVRRGNPALHVAFGEDIALLAGIALLNQAYALFGREPALIAEAAACIGMNGMVGGQVVDLATRTSVSAPVAFSERNRKTSALMRLTMSAGAMACRAPAPDVAALARAGECLGEAYQVCDDMLDEYMLCEDTGKPMRQDARHQRPSHAMQFGPKGCQDHVAELIQEAKGVLVDRFGTTAAVNALLENIDSIVGEFSRAGLVTACS